MNFNLTETEGTPRGEAIKVYLASAGLEDMGLHFLPRNKPWLQDRFTWKMIRDGQEVCSQTD